ncbi:TetR/AcrR family transcriptional regulator C-terminal domain-containing protein [filamentous cyanobacterium LEGE 11480]|uniref:TetR/AcrR family transcriptional regulator C-terminal domain-containing protein n=1 Tax=Romeriopsis navalis LEGE 11480 TaxID=2777977 RepID=A0A928VL78_9CYAN|nr:TetR/AcrR family transcriptional regulator [Romeriopsis navalis]MBE9030360.1 TetR/AcrR family transcriptional regulator C-terminal domain-containing protein [Romeriopsis navalis LEGE 11480]
MAKITDAGATPRIPLSRERVLLAAIELADADGIEALSMRKLAQRLGVKAMSLYNHVANRDEILDGMVDIVVGEMGVPSIATDWKVAMRARANAAHKVLLRHPWAAMALMSRINIGPAMLRYIDATLGCLREAGFSFELADHAWNAIDSHIYGFTLQQLNFPFAEAEYVDAATAYVDQIPAAQYPYMHQLTQHVMSGQYDGIHDFEFGLEMLLDGLDRLRASS